MRTKYVTIVTVLLCTGCFSFVLTESDNYGKIAFISTRDGKSQICVMNVDGTDLINITNNYYNNEHPSWSPDGEKIAFVSDRDGNWEIYVMGVDGSNPANITNNPAEDRSPSWCCYLHLIESPVKHFIFIGVISVIVFLLVLLLRQRSCRSN